MRFSAVVARGLREGAAIALVVLSLVLLVALLSFDANDPGFHSTGEGALIHNRVGPVGAWIASL
ncbi:MAG TPA: DNA translocase FtsK 4TM domain-containing protein, partial [Steroidobacteraceae bacterium]